MAHVLQMSQLSNFSQLEMVLLMSNSVGKPKSVINKIPKINANTEERKENPSKKIYLTATKFSLPKIKK